MKRITKIIVVLLVGLLISSCGKNTIDFKDQTINIHLYESYQIEFNKTDVEQLTFSVDDSTILTVDEQGNILSEKVGITNVIVTKDNKEITLTINILEPRIIISNNVFVKQHSDREFYLNASGYSNNEVQYSSLNPNIILVNDEGRITSVRSGTGIVRINLKNKKKIFIDVVVHVYSELKLNVDIDNFTIIKGINHQLEYESTDPLGVIITSSNEAVLEVTNSGLVIPKNIGTATITLALPLDLTLTKEVKITVVELGDFIPALENEIVNISRTNNKTLGFNFKSSDETIFKVDEFGFIEGIKEGQATLTITSKVDETFIKTILVKVLNGVNYEFARSVQNTNSLNNYTLNITLSQIVEGREVYQTIDILFDNNNIMFSAVNKVQYFITENNKKYHYFESEGKKFKQEIEQNDFIESFLITQLFNYEDFFYYSSTQEYSLTEMNKIKAFEAMFNNNQIINMDVRIKNNYVDRIVFELKVEDEFIRVSMVFKDLFNTIVEVPTYD